MLAAVFVGAGEPLELQELPHPPPGPDEVVLKIHRCGICATDLHMTEDHAFTAPVGFVLRHERGLAPCVRGPARQFVAMQGAGRSLVVNGREVEGAARILA